MEIKEKYTNLLEKYIILQNNNCDLCKEHNALRRIVLSKDEEIKTLRERTTLPLDYNGCPTIHTQRHGDTNDPAEIQETVYTYESRIKELSQQCDNIANSKQESYEQEIANLKHQLECATKETNDCRKANQELVLELERTKDESNISELNERIRDLAFQCERITQDHNNTRRELTKVSKADKIHKKMIEYARQKFNVKFPSMTVINNFHAEKTADTSDAKDIEIEDMQPEHEGTKIAYNEGEPCPHLMRSTPKQIAKIGNGYCTRRCPYFKYIDRDQQLLWCIKKPFEG